MTREEWAEGRGCPVHRETRSGSCHDCAMLQPPPQLSLSLYVENTDDAQAVFTMLNEMKETGKIPTLDYDNSWEELDAA